MEILFDTANLAVAGDDRGPVGGAGGGQVPGLAFEQPEVERRSGCVIHPCP